MPAVRRRTQEEVVIALLWAMFGGGLIGGVFFTLFEGRVDLIAEEPWMIIFGPFLVGALSLFVVAPCTLVFGLPSAALMNHLQLSKYPTLAMCIVTATATQTACVWMLLWRDYSEVSDFLFTTPFAMGAAVVLWWRLTRP